MITLGVSPAGTGLSEETIRYASNPLSVMHLISKCFSKNFKISGNFSFLLASKGGFMIRTLSFRVYAA